MNTAVTRREMLEAPLTMSFGTLEASGVPTPQQTLDMLSGSKANRIAKPTAPQLKQPQPAIPAGKAPRFVDATGERKAYKPLFKRVFKNAVLKDIYVSQAFYDEVEEVSPEARLLLAHLFYKPRRDRDYKENIILSRRLLKKLYTKTGRCHLKVIVKIMNREMRGYLGCQKDVLIKFRLGNSSGRASSVQLNPASNLVQALQNLPVSLSKDLVNVVDGEPIEASYLRKKEKQIAEAHVVEAERNGYGTAACRALLRHLNTLNPATYSTMVKKGVESAEAVAESLQDDVSRDIASFSIKAIAAKPRLTYYAKPDSARIFSRNGLLNTKSEVRKAFFKGYKVYDLKNCQLSVAAYLFEQYGMPCKEIDALANSGDVWTTLLNDAGLTMEEKGSIKVALYSILYGKAGVAVKKDLASEVGKKAARAFMRIPAIKELLTSRDEVLAKLKAEGVVTLAGQDKKVYEFERESRKSATSALARLIQSYETLIMSWAFEALEKYRGTGFFYLYDGMAVSWRPNTMGQQKEWLIEVNSRIEDYGINTELVEDND